MHPVWRWWNDKLKSGDLEDCSLVQQGCRGVCCVEIRSCPVCETSLGRYSPSFVDPYWADCCAQVQRKEVEAVITPPTLALGDWAAGPIEVSKRMLYESYRHAPVHAGRRVDQASVFWRKMREVSVGEEGTGRLRVHGGRELVLILPTLEGCRRRFASFAGTDWSFDE